MTLEETMNEPKMLAAGIRGQIMAYMLNGTIDWDGGNTIRNWSDEKLIKEFGEEYKKSN